MQKITLFFLAAMLCMGQLFAKNPDDSTQVELSEAEIQRLVDSLESTLNYATGKISLGNGIAEINIPSGFKMLQGDQARFIIEDFWGNPPSETPVLGVLFPATTDATSPGGYAYIISFEEMGYVKDKDADKIDYDDLLKDMKKGSAEENKEREKLGLATLNLIGWAAKPYYDKSKKVLYWAKEYQVPGADQNTLNYDIRVLGRKGVLTLQAVAGMDQLDSVNAHKEEVLNMVAFTEGNKYSDFNSSTDNIAAWTIGGLVAGKVLAKAGFFAVILKFIKPIIIGVIFAGGAIWRFITGRKRKKEEEELIPEPVQQHPDQTPIPNDSQ